MKARMVEITDAHELAKLYQQRNDIGTPHVYVAVDPASDYWGPGCFCDADELRAWRELQSTSCEKPE